MKRLLNLLPILASVFFTVENARAVVTLGQPNLIFRNKTTGQNKVWEMNGLSKIGEQKLPQYVDAPEWKIVGVGDFDADGINDIVWNAPAYGVSAVWLMNASLGLKSSVSLESSPSSPNWVLTGVADFDHDGKPDILFHNIATGANVLWLMNGTARIGSPITLYSHPDTHWQVYTVGDMGSLNPSTGVVNPTPDGNVDILLQNDETGVVAVQYMSGISLVGFKSTTGGWSDKDYVLCSTGDYTSATPSQSDGYTDLVWRHSTVGVNQVWPMEGRTLLNVAIPFIDSINDADWRMASQYMYDSKWRISQYESASWAHVLRVSVSPSDVIPGNGQAFLSFNMPNGWSAGITVQRRELGQPSVPQFTTLAPHQDYYYIDNGLEPGKRYEYRVFREGAPPTYKTISDQIMRTTAGFGVPESLLETKGSVLLLVDQTIQSQLSWDDLILDLVGDGWKVLQASALRHDDVTLSNNKSRVETTKNQIKAFKTNNPDLKAVILIGHVPVPYSGRASSDDHSDHYGAWSADMYYSDVTSTGWWTDSQLPAIGDQPECYNAPDDGKFDQDYLPSGVIFDIAIGRIDFAKMPIFTSSISEVNLLQRYLDKNHKFRLKQLPWQSQSADRAMAYGYFDGASDHGMYQLACSGGYNLFGGSQVFIGDVLFPQPRPYLWGFQSGSGLWSSINASNDTDRYLHSALQFTTSEGSAAFYGVYGSYFADWNTSPDNLIKSLIATPNYGLAACALYTDILIDGMGIGESIGETILRTMNQDPAEAEDRAHSDQARMLSIMGDPTLRLHIIAPPSGVSASRNGTSVQLSWAGSVDATAYVVYRSSSALGPFTRISATPITTTSFTDPTAPSTSTTYMIRSFKTTTSPVGTYNNLSQGVSYFVQ